MHGDNIRPTQPNQPSNIQFHGQQRHYRNQYGHAGRLPIPNSQNNRERVHDRNSSIVFGGIQETNETNTGNKENNYSNVFNESEIAP